MKALELETFNAWLETYGRASRENDAQASAALFAPNAHYYETPFDEPMIGRDAIRKYWEMGAQRLKDKESTYEILSIRGNTGIARWQSRFTDFASGRRLALDCLFLVEFDENDLCRVFREWWHVKPLEDKTD
jgi:ketosteroid isomerase-like protein